MSLCVSTAIRRGSVARVVALSACLLILAGCGGGKQLKTANVTGTVTLDGKPLSQGTVVFTPERGRGATGEIGPDGSFTLGTYAKRDGAVVGRHTVTVVCIDPETIPTAANADTMIRWLIPRRYGNPGTSGLSFEVKAGAKNVATLQLVSGPERKETKGEKE